MTHEEVDKAIALSGVGGKWFNWVDSQKEPAANSEAKAKAAVMPAVVSTVLSAEPVLPAPLSSIRGREMSVGPGVGDDLFDGESPESMAANDPLATQLWRMCAKAKAGLPNGARMENITWRMMSLKLNKQRALEAEANSQRAAREEAAKTAAKASHVESLQADKPAEDTAAPAPASGEEEERGRRGRSPASQSVSPQNQ